MTSTFVKGRFIWECKDCVKWRTALCDGVQQDPDRTWDGKLGGCSGFRYEPLPAHPTCESCTKDICGRYENEKRHGGTWNTMSHDACCFWEGPAIPAFSVKTVNPQKTLEVWL